MASLVLKSNRPATGDYVKPGLDWGTGKPRSRSSKSSSVRVSGTYVYTGDPISQTYRNTDLTLSDARINDELIPAPLHTTDITSHQIPLKFPSNHPFTSHISEKSVFPNASVDLNDRPSTYSDPYIVTHKIRGNPFRREVHYHGLQRERNRSLKWPDKHYMQLPRSLSDANSSSIYPWPRKMFVPNNENFTQNATTNIVKNKERALFETTYQNDYSNGESVGYETMATLSPTEEVKPHFTKTFDPARPIEGMQGNHRQPSTLERQKTLIYHSPMEITKVMSESEKLDDHMRNGTDYINLPEHRFPIERAPTWFPQNETPDGNQVQSGENRFLHHLRPSTTGSQISHDHYASHQQMDAENRLQQLDVIRPKENINLLNTKYRSLQNPRHSRPILPQYRDAYVNTLYDQMGTYVQERSGLYHTENYEPSSLAQAISELENQQNYQGEDDSTFKDENNLGDLLNRAEQSQGQSKPKLFQYRAIGDYQNMRNSLLNKVRVPQDSGTVDTRIQEGNKQFVQRESTYGQAYNTKKFLQENSLSYHARIDPSRLMSTRYNNDLERVRSLSSFPMKKITQNNEHKTATDGKSNDILVGPLLHPSPYDELYATKYITEHTNGYSRRGTARVYDSPFKDEHDMTVYKLYQQQQQQAPPSQSTSFDPYLSIPAPLPPSVKTAIRLPGPEIVARFIEPKFEPNTTYQRSYKDISYHETIPQTHSSTLNLNRSTKDNEQSFGRTIGSQGKPWKLRDIQDRWSKTQAQRDYHIAHPEAVPDVGGNTIRAKKEILIADTIAKRGMMTVR